MCRDQIKSIPEGIDYSGEMGWPCHLGGAVDVLRAASSGSAKPRNCIVFYYPDPAPDLNLNPSFAVQSRVTIYNAAAESCITAAQKGIFNENIIVLTDVANCIMEMYPDGTSLTKGRTRLNKLRGVAVFVTYDTTQIEDNPEIGMALPEGRMVVNCQPILELNVTPFSLCHAAMLSAQESGP